MGSQTVVSGGGDGISSGGGSLSISRVCPG